MGFDPASIVGSAAAQGAGAILSGIGSLARDIREAIVGKEMTPEIAADLQKKAIDLEIATQNAQMEMIRAEASSSDPWTSRARPTFMYVFYFMLLFIGIGAPFVGIWYAAQMVTFFANVKLGLAAIPDSLYTLFGAGYLGYTGARMSEKKVGATK